MKSEIDQREFTRIPMQLEVQITPTPQHVTSYQVKNVSMNGLYLLCEQPLSLGTECRVTLLLGGKESPVRVEGGGKVVRVDTDGLGVEITEIVGVES
ncbi:MAG: PilZ domain-containing protein, partial [Candidatus Binatia bacterium]